MSSRGRGSPASRGRGYTSAAAAAAAAALPKNTGIPKGAVKTVTLTAGGIIKRAVPQGRIAGATITTTPTKSSTTVATNSPKKQVTDELDEEVLEELEGVMREHVHADKKDGQVVNKTATQNGSKPTSTVTPNSRGRGRGGISKASPAKSISSPTRQDKDHENSDSPIKEGPKIIRLKSNSAAEVLKSTSATCANSEPSNEDDITSKTNSTAAESNKRKAVPITPTNNTSNESPSITGSAESRSKRQRKEKKIFDL